MARSTFWIAVLALLLFPLASQLNALKPKAHHVKPKAAAATQLTQPQISSGLKDALAVGTQKAVLAVARPGGYLENQEIKILLPPHLRPVEKDLRAIGQGPRIDEFVASMNHAAESAAPEAARIFSDAVKQMTIDDARSLLTGGKTSVTDYFKAKTSTQLATAFRPHVEAAMKKNGVEEKYQEVAGRVPKLPFVNESKIDINGYVVQKSLDGLFFMLGKEEEKIRANPVARTTSLLKQVFGSI